MFHYFSERYGRGRKVIFAEVDWSYGSMGPNRQDAFKSSWGFRNDLEERKIGAAGK